ncbi:MAG: DUF2804 domain-containing protein [Acidimicrobiia bacterium]|nr:DUF2804 domain-containing protein [Acidimicrobiia bacterium]
MEPTHEREITEPVDLCTPDGRRLAPEARGWSRTPLHTANLRGSWGRTKRWDYWAVLAGDLTAAVTYADVDYLGMATVWWCDLATGETGGRPIELPLARGVALPDRPGATPLTYRGKGASVEIVDDPEGTSIEATWSEKDGRPGRLSLRVELPAGHESVNVVIPWSDRRFQYTSKHQARPASGSLTVGGERRGIGVDEGGSEAWGVLDVGRGRWPYSTRWNWGGGAGRSTTGAVVGVQFGAMWTEGTGFTENGVIIDGRVTKIGQELTWDYDGDRPLEPWRVHHPDGSLDLTLAARHDRHSRTNAVVLFSEVHQVFGTWKGHVTDDAGTIHQVEALQGFAEESRSRW